MKEAFDYELDSYLESTEDVFECPECGEEVSEQGRHCSRACWEASML